MGSYGLPGRRPSLLAGVHPDAGRASVSKRPRYHDRATEWCRRTSSQEPSRCPTTETYDILVIGSGEAGKYLAWTMAGAGHRTAVIERKLIGGSCPNIACLPSKNIIHSAKVRSFTRRAAEFGVELESAATSMNGVQARKRAMVDGLRRLHLDRYRASGAELIMGEARFVGERTVDVESG